MPKGAERVSKHLDLLIELAEPEQFVSETLALIGSRPSPRWDVVKKGLTALEAELQFMNEPSPKGAEPEAS